MVLYVLGGTVLVFVIIMGDTYLSSRDIILQQARQNATDLADAMAQKIEKNMWGIAKVPQALAGFIEICDWTDKTLLKLIQRQVEDHPEIYGSAVAFEPGAYHPNQRSYAPYFYRTPIGIRFVQLATDNYDYFMMNWYHVPRTLGVADWSEPYLDEGGGGVIMSTYSVPFFQTGPEGGAPHIRGIITADVSLDWLSELIARISREKTGYAFLMSEFGTFIAHPRTEYIMRESVFSLAETYKEPELRKLGRDMIRKPEGFVGLNSILTDNKPAFLAYTRVQSTGWCLAVVFPKDELLNDLYVLNQRAAIMAGIGILLLFLIILLIARSITGPLRRIVQATARMAGGDLEIDLKDIRGRDEVGRLARSFDRMSTELKQYICDLTEATAARERIEGELNIAAQIQKSILPCCFPPFPDRDEFDLYAMMQPAREVAGDFYDFFFIDDDRLALIMADVSGKGIPASLFMMVSRTMLKSIATRGEPPDVVLAEANNLLCQGNDTVMFVTVFLAYYDVGTGRLTYANGGHNPALLLDSEGHVREFGQKKGAALGFMPDLPYQVGEMDLKTGETLVLYTDGVTEALSPEEEMFGEERFAALLGRNRGLALEDQGNRVGITLDEFQAGNQFDDITIMFMKRKR